MLYLHMPPPPPRILIIIFLYIIALQVRNFYSGLKKIPCGSGNSFGVMIFCRSSYLGTMYNTFLDSFEVRFFCRSSYAGTMYNTFLEFHPKSHIEIIQTFQDESHPSTYIFSGFNSKGLDPVIQLFTMMVI